MYHIAVADVISLVLMKVILVFCVDHKKLHTHILSEKGRKPKHVGVLRILK